MASPSARRRDDAVRTRRSPVSTTVPAVDGRRAVIARL